MLTLKIPRNFEVLISIHCLPGLVAEAFHPDVGVYTPDELARIRYDFANRFYAEIEEASMNGSMRIRSRVGRVIDPKNFRNPGDVHTDWNTVAPHDLIDYLKDLDPAIVFIEPPANTAAQPASDVHKQASPTPEPQAAPAAPAADTQPQAAPAKAGNAQRWTPEFTSEVNAYRGGHTELQTAENFGVSGALIRRKLAEMKSANKPNASPFSGLQKRSN